MWFILRKVAGCPHDVWKRFNIGFDSGWCCARCKVEMEEPVCDRGGRTTFRQIGDHGEFRCMFGCCGFGKYVRVSETYLDGQ